MKRCPYCGRENSDDAIICVIDHTPLGGVSARAAAEEEGEKSSCRIRFAWVSEEEIPVSLIVLSYLYFIPGAAAWAFFISGSIGLMLFGLHDIDVLGFQLLMMVVGGGLVAIFFTCLSRGLRRGARGWRTCALIWIWWHFLCLAWAVGVQFFYPKDRIHQSVQMWMLGIALSLAIPLWQYRVLTRRDVREHFGVY